MINRLSFLSGIILIFIAALAHAEEIEIPVETLLGPSTGYEEKNNIQVVLYGALPNSCYSLGEYRVEKNLETKTVRVRQFAFRERDGVCANEANLPENMLAAIPFTTEVSVGKLAVGEFTFLYYKEGGGTGKRVVSITSNITPTVDSRPYAIVSGISVRDVINGPSEIQLSLEGVLTSSCMEIDPEVKVLKQPDVFVLLPTVTRRTGVMCADALIPYKKKVNLGKAIPGRYLIHSRSMNGKSVNRVILVAR